MALVGIGEVSEEEIFEQDRRINTSLTDKDVEGIGVSCSATQILKIPKVNMVLSRIVAF